MRSQALPTTELPRRRPGRRVRSPATCGPWTNTASSSEQVRRSLLRPAPSLEDPRLAEAQADVMERVIREIIGGLDLPPEQHERGLALAAAALRRAAREDEHHGHIVTADQHRLPTGRDQQS